MESTGREGREGRELTGGEKRGRGRKAKGRGEGLRHGCWDGCPWTSIQCAACSHLISVSQRSLRLRRRYS